jgi:TonB family protein
MRQLTFLGLIAALLCGVRTLAGSQDFNETVNSYVSRKLILRSYGDAQEVTMKVKDLNRPAGTCDKAVEVVEARHVKDQVVLQLEQIGDVRAGGNSHCLRSWSITTFTITDLGAMSPQAFASVLQDLFLSPEAYLARNGHRFDLQPLDETGPVRPLRRDITPPKPVLQINPEFTEEARKNRIGDSRVGVEIVVGLDGRVHSSRVIRGVGYGLDEQALRVLPLWRFEPARQGDQPVAIRINMEFTFNLR